MGTLTYRLNTEHQCLLYSFKAFSEKFHRLNLFLASKTFGFIAHAIKTIRQSSIHRFSFVFLIFLATTLDLNTAHAKKTSKKPLAPKLLPAERATSELKQVQSKAKASKNISDSPQGIFTYQEPELQFAQRPFAYIVGFRVEHLQPKGVVHSEIVGDFNLNSYQMHWFPLIEFGISKNNPHIWDWQKWTLLAQLGYSSYSEQVQFSSGFWAPPDTRLNTLRANLFWKAEVLKPELLPFRYSYGASFGKVYYAQTSSNDLAQFAENLYFLGFHGGAIYPINQFLETSIEYVYRLRTHSSALAIEPHNLEFGMSILW